MYRQVTFLRQKLHANWTFSRHHISINHSSTNQHFHVHDDSSGSVHRTPALTSSLHIVRWSFISLCLLNFLSTKFHLETCYKLFVKREDFSTFYRCIFTTTMFSTRRAHFILKRPNHGAAFGGEREIVSLEFVQKLLSILLILNEKLFTLFTLFTFDWTIHSFFRILEEIWKMHGAGAWPGEFCSLLRVLSILPNQPVKNQWSYQEKMERQSLLSNQAIYILTEIGSTA